MKIKIDKIRIIGKIENIELNNIQFEISTNEILQMNEFENKKNVERKIPDPPILPKSFFRYVNMPLTMQEGDLIEILPSDDCVTNGDTIKYDERISGCTARIQTIFLTDNKIKIKSTSENKYKSFNVNVHPTWVKLILRK